MKQPSRIDDCSAASIARYMPYAPEKLAKSELPVKITCDYFAAKAYQEDRQEALRWKQMAFEVLSGSHVGLSSVSSWFQIFILW